MYNELIETEQIAQPAPRGNQGYEMKMKQTTQHKWTTTDFECTLNQSKIMRSRAYPEFIFHDAVAFNYIEINGKKLYCEYQTGQHYNHNDYSCPTNAWAIYRDNSNDLVSALDALVESDFENEEQLETAHETAEQEFGHKISTDELFEIYQFLNDNDPGYIWDLLSEHSSDPDDYIIDDEDDTAKLKSES